jgi:hypothetical protein
MADFKSRDRGPVVAETTTAMASRRSHDAVGGSILRAQRMPFCAGVERLAL